MKFFKCMFVIIIFASISYVCIAQEIIQDNPMIKEGIDQYKAGKYDQAINIFSEVIRQSVEKEILYSAYFYLGYCYYTIEDLGNAKSRIEDAINTIPDKKPNEEDFVPEFIDYFNSIKRKIIGIGFFESIPKNAIIYLDDIKIGTTPQKNELLNKKYFLRMVKYGYEPFEAEFNIQSNEIRNIKIDLREVKNWRTFSRSAVIMIGLSIILNLL